VAPANGPGELNSEELSAILNNVRERVRARHPTALANTGIPLPDLMPLFHARDAAESKVAAIGTVNPRPGGLLNRLIQAVKRGIARLLDWHVREQIEFNRQVMGCIEAILQALTENNRVLAEIDPQQARDMRAHWAEWRQDWERRLALNEAQFQRSLAELHGAFQHRASVIEANFRDVTKAQHLDFSAALEHGSKEIQKRLWEDLKKVRTEFEQLIHTELRLIRQRVVDGNVQRPPIEKSLANVSSPGVPFDYARFSEQFRGGEESIRERQRFYLPYFSRCRRVLDLGCGRGEFLELLRDTGVVGQGIDLNPECIATCIGKGLDVQAADLFTYLQDLPERSLDGVFSAQVVEHLPPERVPEMVRLVASRLEAGGLLAIETPNPQCLAIFASHFYLDPTHTRPLPHPLLAFYMTEYGFGNIEVHPLAPAIDTLPGLSSLPEDFRQHFFGGLDYAILGRKLI